jgi:hypothetical protein
VATSDGTASGIVFKRFSCGYDKNDGYNKHDAVYMKINGINNGKYSSAVSIISPLPL